MAIGPKLQAPAIFLASTLAHREGQKLNAESAH
jgi:hypothetical protein